MTGHEPGLYAIASALRKVEIPSTPDITDCFPESGTFIRINANGGGTYGINADSADGNQRVFEYIGRPTQ